MGTSCDASYSCTIFFLNLINKGVNVYVVLK